MIRMISIGWFKRFIARLASEELIAEMRLYDPKKLAQLQKFRDDPPAEYPWYDGEKSMVFWRTYRRLMKEPRHGQYARQ